MERRVRVAFVDDEATVLTSLRRTMLAMLDEWEMAFFTKGADLLQRWRANRSTWSWSIPACPTWMVRRCSTPSANFIHR